MTVSADYLAYILDQLTALGGVTSRRMFGGVGLYCEELFFAIIDDDVLYFKADDSNRGDYQALGMKRFCPFPDQPQYEMGYYEVPADALEDPEALAVWARKSLAVAATSKKQPRKRRAARKQARKPR
ncbi:MAG TPA: TfoX/Sxy family protein [Steroidobacteraceae bacterium]|nr:TfoX/Sxy family protein [Steroidobacteraceae bacterium]